MPHPLSNDLFERVVAHVDQREPTRTLSCD